MKTYKVYFRKIEGGSADNTFVTAPSKYDAAVIARYTFKGATILKVVQL